ncbi:trehalose-phosphatase [Hydrogenivirga sp.]
MIILLDYDGTLTPIVSEPEEAKLGKNRKEFLRELSKKHKVAIITGRSMESFRKVFGKVPETIYVITSHGARIYRDERLLRVFETSKLPDLTPLKEKIENEEGLLLEEKEGCFAIHYRNFKGDEAKVRRLFEDFVSKNPPKKVLEGKKVLEAVYTGADKGKAVENFLKLIGWDGREKVVYIGDDTTDLFALRKVRELGGIPVFVGDRRPPEADILLKDVDDVYEFLSGLEELVNHE